MKTGALNVSAEVGFYKLNEAQETQTIAFFLLLILIFFSCGSVATRGETKNFAELKITGSSTCMILKTALYGAALNSPTQERFKKKLPGFVQAARETAGRVDITSARALTSSLDQTQDRKDPKGSVRIIEDSFLPTGPNTRSPNSLNEDASQIYCAMTPTRNKRITIESPTSNPLSFAWEYLQTKK